MLRIIVGWIRIKKETWEESVRRMKEKINIAMLRYHKCADWEDEIWKYQFNYELYNANSHPEPPWRIMCT